MYLLAMTGSDIIILLVGILLMALVISTMFWNKKYLKNWYRYNPKPTYEINDNKPISECVGKLVRKVVDERTVSRYRYTSRGIRQRLLPYDLPKDYYYRYYLTFETFEGYKGFTVTKENYRRYRKDTYGIIRYQKSKFVSFEVKDRSELNIPDRYDKD